MQDRDLDKVIGKWVDDETASAPKMRPTAEMYEQVASLGRKRSRGLFALRRLVWTTGLAALVVLVLTYVLVYSPVVVPGAGQQVAQVPQRAAFAADKGQTRSAPPPKGKGPRGGASPFRQLLFEVRGADSPAVRSVDVLAPGARPIVLTADDSYRLLLESVAARYVYVYQQAPTGALSLLYPNEAYSPKQNPMLAAETAYLPAAPSGFYLEGEVGRFRLYIVAAEEPASELETLYARYSARGIRFDRDKRLALLEDRLETLAGGLIEGTTGWVFEFEVR
jgi:hypothetical protein